MNVFMLKVIKIFSKGDLNSPLKVFIVFIYWRWFKRYVKDDSNHLIKCYKVAYYKDNTSHLYNFFKDYSSSGVFFSNVFIKSVYIAFRSALFAFRKSFVLLSFCKAVFSWVVKSILAYPSRNKNCIGSTRNSSSRIFLGFRIVVRSLELPIFAGTTKEGSTMSSTSPAINAG